MENYGSYTPVDPDFYDKLTEIAEKNTAFRVFYFLPDQSLGEANGEYSKIKEESDGEFLIIENAEPVRIDRVITVNGKPGPSYDEYIAYADACLSCQAGYDETDL